MGSVDSTTPSALRVMWRNKIIALGTPRTHAVFSYITNDIRSTQLSSTHIEDGVESHTAGKRYQDPKTLQLIIP